MNAGKRTYIEVSTGATRGFRPELEDAAEERLKEIRNFGMAYLPK